MGYRQRKTISFEYFFGSEPARNRLESAEKRAHPWKEERLRLADGEGFTTYENWFLTR